MSFPSAFPPSDIRELAEANEFYRMTKAEYIERGELLTLALFDCALQTSYGAFDKVKRLVNFYATGQLSISLMHSDILGICLQAGDECGLSNWPLKVFRHEFYLLLGGMSTQKRDEAIFYHDMWRKNSIPLPRSPPQEQEQEPTTPQASFLEVPPSIKAERAAAVAVAAQRTETAQGIVDADLYRQRLAAQEAAVSGAQISDLNNLLCRPCHETAPSARPCYNNLTWPSPLPRLVALEAGLTTNKRCKHEDAIALIAKRMKCSPEDFYEMSRSEVRERLFNDHHWAPGASMGVLKLLSQTSRYW